MAEKKDQKIEREYVIPLRSKFRLVPCYKRANKAMKAIKEFLAKHMKVEDRDLNKVKVDKYINEFVWYRSIKRPPAKVKVKAVKNEDGTVNATLIQLPDKLKFKKQREEKLEKASKEIAEKRKQEKQSAQEQAKQALKKTGSKEDQDKDGVEDKVEEKEKQEAVEETKQENQKQESKKKEHITKNQTKPKEEAAKKKTSNKTR